MNKIESASEQKATRPAQSTGIARRRLMSAGLAAAPVMLVLKSPSAFASTGEHLNCSMWASLNAANGCKASHAPIPVKTCKSFEDWGNEPDDEDAEKNKEYHLDDQDRSKSADFDGSHYNKIDSSTNTVYKPSLKEVCRGKRKKSDGSYEDVKSSDPERDLLAKHCAAMHLNIKKSIGCPFNETQVNAIWSTCKDSEADTVQLTSNVSWTRRDCNEYFDYVSRGILPGRWQGNLHCASPS